MMETNAHEWSPSGFLLLLFGSNQAAELQMANKTLCAWPNDANSRPSNFRQGGRNAQPWLMTVLCKLSNAGFQHVRRHGG
jgi:hypothetical protein